MHFQFWHNMTIAKGLFINYVDTILVIYDQLPTPMLTFLFFNVEGSTIVGPQPTHSFLST